MLVLSPWKELNMSLEQTANGKRNLSIRRKKWSCCDGEFFKCFDLEMLMWRLDGKLWLHIPEGGQGSPISACRTVLSDAGRAFLVHWGDLKEVRFFQRTPNFSTSSIAPKFRFVSWTVTVESFMLERAMRALLKAGSALGSDYLGICPVGSWNSQGRRLHSPSGPILQSLVILKGK